MSDFAPVRIACDLLGGITALAKQLSVAPQVVHRWASGQQTVPIIRCVEIEKLTNGAVTRKMLRPNDWDQIWPELCNETKKL